MTKPHRCDEHCTCPVHATPLIYWPAGDMHACTDISCAHGHGCRPEPILDGLSAAILRTARPPPLSPRSLT